MRDDAVDTPTPAPEASGTPASPAAGEAALPATVNGGAVSDDLARLTDEIVTAIKTVYDPEIPADVYELGLIYKIDIADDRAVHVEMTLTTPNCPSAQELPTMVENAVASVPGVGPVDVKVVWDPPWEPSRTSDEARVVLNMW
jgi:FeS assembly SUF system protein